MKEKKLFDAITDLPDPMVMEAEEYLKQKKRKRKVLFTSLAACAVLTLGVASIGIQKIGTGVRAIREVAFPKAYAYDDYDTRSEIREKNPVEESFLKAVQEFAWQTSAVFLENKKENVNYSPLSLYYALSLAASGAEGKTAEELLSLLGVDSQEQLSDQCSNLYRLLYADNKIAKCKIANSLWLSKDITFQTSYINNAAEKFYAPAYHVDFADKRTTEAMAKWIADNTNGVLQPELKENTERLMTILNTIYYKNEWVDRFDKDKTKADSFYLSEGGTVECDYMNRTYGSAGFYKGTDYTKSSLSLKYFGEMVFILPEEGVSVYELLEEDKLKEIFEAEQNGYGEVVWQIPKFDFGWDADMKDMLKTLGVSAAFNEKEADFSRITKEFTYISDIRQETHISIDEKGVEAAAFTQIDYSGAGRPQDRADMILNRPFLYAIETNDGIPVFIGICENPIER